MARITVTPADEDEVVIAGARVEPASGEVAGASSVANAAGWSSAPEEWQAASAEFGSNEMQQAPVVAQAPAADEAAGAEFDRAPSAERASGSVTAHVEGGARGTTGRKRDEPYRETTLEDLESPSMPFAQKVVIVAAVVCIIGALVYYFVAMR